MWDRGLSAFPEPQVQNGWGRGGAPGEGTGKGAALAPPASSVRQHGPSTLSGPHPGAGRAHFHNGAKLRTKEGQFIRQEQQEYSCPCPEVQQNIANGFGSSYVYVKGDFAPGQGWGWTRSRGMKGAAQTPWVGRMAT